MTIQTVGSTLPATYATQSSNSGQAGIRKEFRGLESSLLNGDLGGAQASIAALQQALGGAQGSPSANPVLSQLGQSGSVLGKDLQAVSSALGSNDIAGAQKAFATLQQDMEGAFQANGASQAHHGHHAHRAKGSDGDAGNSATPASGPTALNSLLQSMSNSTSTGSSATDLMNAMQSLASSNPKVAADMVTLMKDMTSSGSFVRTSA
jgi:hypothetical protein